jgi:hypothetical protein
MWAVGIQQVTRYESQLGPDGRPVVKAEGTAPAVFDTREVRAPVTAPTTQPVP